MDAEEIRAFVNTIKVCFLASWDGSAVHVRGMRIYRADKEGLLLKVLRYKDVYQQLVDHPQIELCFFDEAEYRQLRLNGSVSEVTDARLRDEVAANCPHYQRDIREHGIEVLRLFRLAQATGSLWSGDMLTSDLRL